MNLRDIDPSYYRRSKLPSLLSATTTAGRQTLVMGITSCVLPASDFYLAATNIDLSVASNWDSVATDYTIAANRAGKDFYIYAVPGKFLLSANSTVPTGYTTSSSRKIGGFHCLCLSVGTISGHDLSGFLTGDILPASIWDLNFRSSGLQNGMAYIAPLDSWWMIYLQSNTGASTGSVFGATITNNRNWMDFVDDLGAVGLRLPTDAEFQIASDGSNQQTNIAGSADPVTTGGHVDTSSRRMISSYGLEDCCGVVWQWLSDQSYQNDVAYSATFGYYSLPGSKGQLYRQSTTGDVKLLAGGGWSDVTYCGSRSRTANSARWYTYAYFGARGCALNIVK